MPRRLALLVATYRYQDAGLRQLAAPAQDADALAEVLRHPDIADFDVTTLVNEPHHVVGRAIGEFYRNRHRDDLTLLYFTGHGLKDDDGRLYLAMTNTTRNDLLFTALSAQQIDYAIDSCTSRQKVLVLDCCYSGAFPAGRISKTDAQVHTLEKFQGKGRVVLTASDATQYSFEGNDIIGQGIRSVFTRFLVEGLTTGEADLDGDGDISLDELYSYVYDRVTEEMPQQRPKKLENVEGRIVIAKNIHWRLPAYIRNAIESPFMPDRLAVLEGLARLYRLGNDGVRTEVINQTRRLIHDNNEAVSAAAMDLMAALNPEQARRDAEERARRDAEKPRWIPAVSSPALSLPVDDTTTRRGELVDRADVYPQNRAAAEKQTPQRRAWPTAGEQTRRNSDNGGGFGQEDIWKRIFQPLIPRRLGGRGMALAAPGALVILLAVVVVVILTATVHLGTSPAPKGPVGAVPPGLEGFYGQGLSWTGCSAFAATPRDKTAYADPGLQCAYLNVPLDYANPNGRVIKVGLLRRPASDPAHRIGSLVLNPGGPGGSGMSTAASLADEIKDNDVGRRFDFVGFDPRGVGSSEPQVTCRTKEDRDAERLMNLNVDTSPASVAKTEAQEKADDEGCVKRTGKEVLANIGTRDVVRDMDVMRSALGDEKLTYLGYSYGTRIGTSYAEVFPKNVRAMILDGAIDPAQDSVSQLLDQGRGFQKSFDAFAAWCAGRADCALGQDKGQAVNNFQAHVRPLINQPVGVSDGRKLSYIDATIGVIQALYLSDLWPTLNRGLRELVQGRPDTLMRLADIYNGRSQDGTYSTEMDVFQAVLCVDNPPIKDPNVARDVDAQYRKVAPFLDTGQPPSPALDNCAFWPVPSTGGPHHPQTPGLPTVMVISTTQDPATPYQAGVNLAHDLNARLLTYEGTQHTAILQGNGCVDNAGISYFTNLQLPPEGTRCKPAS